MSLKLKLKPGERLIINGCVIRNGEKRLDIEIENRADVLRGNDMLDDAGAQTPVRRLCYLIQIALVSKERRALLLPDILTRISQLHDILHVSHGDTLDQVRDLVEAEDFYAGMRKLLPVIRHEEVLLCVPVEGRARKIEA